MEEHKLAKIKKGDFVELDYDGYIKDDNLLFDTTDEKKAKEHGIFSQKTEYGKIIICIGEHQILPGIDRFLEGKEPGKYEISLTPEEAFGKKDSKLLKLIPSSAFKKSEVKPMQGLQVNIDGMIGIIRSVNGGRIIVDFNHPLSGKDIRYELKVDRIVEDDSEKVSAVVNLALGIGDSKTEIKEGKAQIKFNNAAKLPEEIKKHLSDRISKLVGTIKESEFVE
jgi:FKBP-type peptidyl-prolyl cis-trans isomerase 2